MDATVAGTPMVYKGDRYPYFFADANGVADEDKGRPVTYKTRTPRQLKATFNWKLVTSDRGVHVHNPHYALELLHDSIQDLLEPMDVDFAGLGLLR